MLDPLIEIRKIKDVDLKGGIVIDGFPSVGLANAIASECLVNSLKTEFVAVIDSPNFSAMSVIRNAAPNFPARIYANEELKLGIFVSELYLDQSMYRPIARTILQWTLEHKCELVISAAGVPYDETEMPTSDAGLKVYGAGSTSSALKRLADAGIEKLVSGSVTGIPAILLNEGAWSNLDVIVLLVKVLKDAPDFRAAAAVSESLSKLAPGASCDIGSLLKEAELVEKSLKHLRSGQASGALRDEMYG